IHLARESIGIAEAPVKMQHDGVRRMKLAGILGAIGQEVDLAQRFVASVEPRVEPAGLAEIVSRGNHQTIRLNALINLRNVPAYHEPRSVGPRRLSRGKLHRALLALLEQRLCRRDLRRLKEFVVLERDADRFLKNENVGKA